MNLNQITPGVEYAFMPSRGRSEEFRWNDRDNDRWHDGTYLDKYFVYRVRAIRAYSQREIGKKRDTGYVDVFWLTNDGEFKLDENGSEIIKKVRVRDIATVWDDYEDELDYRTVQREKENAEREERLRLRREQYEREEAERRERIEQARLAQERERREREERERIEKERIERERREYCNKIETYYKLPTGSVEFSGASGFNDLILHKDMVDLDMQAVPGLMKWSSN